MEPRQQGPASRTLTKLGALTGFIGLSAIAGLLITVGVTPMVAVANSTAQSSVAIFDQLPSYLEIGKLPQRNVLFANQGGKQVPFATIYHQNRVAVADDQVSQTIKDALVAGEDKRFFEHNGVDATSTARAVVGVVTKKERGGGSTLTMQLVRNILVAEAEAIEDPAARAAAYKDATKQAFGRKLAEMKYALGIEKKYSKDQILLAYLNISYFGDQAYGIEAASQHYFGKSAKDVSAAEAASLIAMVQSPSARNLATAKNYPANKARRDVILQAMLDEKKIDPAAFDKAIATPIASYVHLTPATQGCAAVADKAAGQWCDLIKRTAPTLASLGKNVEERAENWKTGGYEIHTSLDLDLNNQAKQQVATYAPTSETRYDLGGVVVSLEAKTGRVIVMTQNRDFDDTKPGTSGANSINYAVDQDLGGSSGFQPGSTYKPFTLLEWLKTGHKLYDSVNATPRDFSPMTICGAPSYTTFTPRNDNGGNPGQVTALQATQQSINTAFVAMAQKLDLCDIRDTAKSLGVHPANPDDDLSAYPSSVIGSGNEVAPLTMAAAFAGIANDGVFCEPTFIDSVIDADGKKLAGQTKNCSQKLDPTIAATAISAMQTPFNGGTATSANPRDGIPVMGKTGTTDHAEQTWLVGSTTNVTTAAWVGNVTGHQNQYNIAGAYGVMNTQRLTIWKNVMQRINQVYGGGAFAAAPSSALYAPAPPPVTTKDDEAGSTPSSDAGDDTEPSQEADAGDDGD